MVVCAEKPWWTRRSLEPDVPHLKVLDGGRRALEEQLLREFMHPGVDNLEKVRTIARALRPKGAGDLVVVGTLD